MMNRALVHRLLRVERILQTQPPAVRRKLSQITSKPIPSLALMLAMGAALPAEAETLLVETDVPDAMADGSCSLVEAIDNANADAQVHPDCAAGSGADVIDLQGQTYVITSGIGGTQGLPSITSPIRMEGRSSTIRVSPVPVDTVLNVEPSGDLELRETTITGDRGSGSTINAHRVRNAGTLYLSDVTVVLNFPSSAGISNTGQLDGERVALELAGSIEAGTDYGGNGFHNEGDADLRQLAVSGLSAFNDPTGDQLSTIVNDGTLVLNEATVSDNYAAFGSSVAGIINRGTLTGRSVTVEKNYAGYIGNFAGVANEPGGTLRLYDSEVSSNEISGTSGGVSNHGEALLERVDMVSGGLFNRGDLRVVDSGLRGSNSDYGPSGVWNTGTLELEGVTIANHFSAFGSSGLTNLDAATATVVNSTIVNNGCYQCVAGVDNSGQMSITASTIAGNWAASMEGMVFNRAGAQLSLVQTLVAGRHYNPELARLLGPIISNAGAIETRHNLFGDSSQTTAQALVGFTPDGSDILATSDGDAPTPLAALLDTQLDTQSEQPVPKLADNGGPTETVALVAGSPALNGFSSPDCPAVDQRGVSRPQGSGCDAGAFELDETTLSSTQFLRCPGDTDGDGVAELVVVSGNGIVSMSTINGTGRTQLTLEGLGQVVDVSVVPDTNTNGSPELAALGRNGMVQVWDPMTRTRLATAMLDSTDEPRDLEWLSDIGGDGIADLAALAGDRALLHDSVSGSSLGSVTFSPYIQGVDLVTPAEPAPTGSALGVVGENESADGADKLEFRDPARGGITRAIWLGKRWQVHQAQPLADLNGNGAHEWAVLRNENEAVSVLLRDGESQVHLGSVEFAPWIQPLHLETIGDVNGNGAGELVVLGRYPGTGGQPMDVKDAATGEQLRRVWFNRSFPVQDATQCPDVNGNGSPEIGVVGQRESDGQVVVFLKDPLTGERVRRIQF
jgi:hypothetical protein